MSFDWKSFLDNYAIESIDRGPGTAKGNVYVRCPFCAVSNDPFLRMGISMRGRGWGCWRDTSHRGKAPHRLVQALLGCTVQEAARIVGDSGEELPPVDDSSFADHVAAMMRPGRPSEPVQSLSFTPEIKPLAGYPLGSRVFL